MGLRSTKGDEEALCATGAFSPVHRRVIDRDPHGLPAIQPKSLRKKPKYKKPVTEESSA